MLAKIDEVVHNGKMANPSGCRHWDSPVMRLSGTDEYNIRY